MKGQTALEKAKFEIIPPNVFIMPQSKQKDSIK